MARFSGAKTKPLPQKLTEEATLAETNLKNDDLLEDEDDDLEDEEEDDLEDENEDLEDEEEEEEEEEEVAKASESEALEIEDCLNALKTLLSAVEKLQKVKLEVGDIKPLLLRMLDGEVMSGEELEQLKTGVGGLFRLVRAYGDHQSALANAQPARTLLDQVLKVRDPR